MRLLRALSHWVDLGNVSGYSCFSLPETCGPNGASLTAWIKIIDCPTGSGFITSKEAGAKTGFYTNCSNIGVKLVHCNNFICNFFSNFHTLGGLAYPYKTTLLNTTYVYTVYALKFVLTVWSASYY